MQNNLVKRLIRRFLPTACCLLPTAFCLLATGCQQQMADQPSYRPLEPSDFFDDGRSARPLVEGTVPRGRSPRELRRLRGKEAGDSEDAVLAAALVGVGAAPGFGAIGPVAAEGRADARYVTAFPFPVTREALERGRERYTIFCSVCHGTAGYGDGQVVKRGYTRPPSYHTDYSRGLARRGVQVLLREAPVGYLYEVVTHGYGAMPSYAEQVPARDRWHVVAYVRALQLSQHARLDDLPEAERDAARKALEGKP